MAATTTGMEGREGKRGSCKRYKLVFQLFLSRAPNKPKILGCRSTKNKKEKQRTRRFVLGSSTNRQDKTRTRALSWGPIVISFLGVSIRVTFGNECKCFCFFSRSNSGKGVIIELQVAVRPHSLHNRECSFHLLPVVVVAWL